MIFVTTGTAAPFEKLIQASDDLGNNEKIICQIGNGKYIPKNSEYFRFKPSIDNYFDKAEIIITHGGAGTLYALLKKGKKIIGIMNDERKGDLHQEEILKKLSLEGYIIWCKDLKNLSKCVAQARKKKLVKYVPPECSIVEKIRDFIEK